MTAMTATPANTPSSQSLGRRAARRFWANRRGRISLIVFLAAFFLSLFAELLSNDRPLVVSFQDELYFPLIHNYPESTFGGDFQTATDYLDPYIRKQFDTSGN
ncbi:MAG: ABC transporter permease, partial [Burkholderiaceae bacterium]